MNKSVVHILASHKKIRYKDTGEFVLISVVNFTTNEYILDHTESTSNTKSEKHTINLKW